MSAINTRSDVTRQSRGLTANEARLVEVIAAAAEQGKTLSREEAGTLAGYGSGETARVSASRALAREPVRKALLERARDVIAMDALHAAAMLRHVRESGSRAQQLTASVETLKLTGLGAPDPGGMSGQMIAVQVVLPAELGTLLTQHAAQQPQALAHPRVIDGEHSLPEGEGGRKRSGRAAGGPPRGGSKRAAKGGRGAKPAATARRRAPHTIFPASGTVSEGETRDE